MGNDLRKGIFERKVNYFMRQPTNLKKYSLWIETEDWCLKRTNMICLDIYIYPAVCMILRLHPFFEMWNVFSLKFSFKQNLKKKQTNLEWNYIFVNAKLLVVHLVLYILLYANWTTIMFIVHLSNGILYVIFIF